MAPLGSAIEPPTLQWPEPDAPTPADLARLLCPACGDHSAKSLMLTVTVRLPASRRKRLNLLRCAGCTAQFYDDQAPPDYAEPALNSQGRIPFYVQQGAGLNLLIQPLAKLTVPAQCRYMEVGCGYGFGLDYALNTRGWEAIGVDPAPLAALGRDALRLPIELRYLSEDDAARGTMDVVAGAEVIEHLSSPVRFIRTLRAMLRPGGILVLTTPNGEDVQPQTPLGVLIPLLSPGLHLVIQSARSLRQGLREAGFSHAQVEVDGHTLVAFASDTTLALQEDAAALRRDLRRHLERRAAATDPAGDPFLGFAGRAFQESVNDGDWEAARQTWSLLAPACLARFGLDLDTLEALPARMANADLDEMGRLTPLNLAGLLYGSAIYKLSERTERASLETRFLLAANAADAVRRALRDLAMEDGQTEEIGWAATAEALLCASETPTTDVITRLAALGPAPAGPGRREQVWLRALTSIVNRAKYELAAALIRHTGSHLEAFAKPDKALRTDAERDALYSLAILALNCGEIREELGGYPTARDRLVRLRDHVQPGIGLWWGSIKAEIEAREALGDARGVAFLSALPRPDQPAQVSPPRGRTLRAVAGALRHRAIPAAINHLVVSSPNQAVSRWPVSSPVLGSKICVFAHWNPRGDVRQDVLRHVERLTDSGFAVIFVSNAGMLSVEVNRVLQSICAAILVRRNIGYDFGGWREAMAAFSLPQANTELLVLANDSVVGPVQPLRTLWDGIDFSKADVWACTESWEVDYHLQSYWMAFGRVATSSAAWHTFWAGVRPLWNKNWLVRNYEIGLTRTLMRAGLRCQAVWPQARLLPDMTLFPTDLAVEQAQRVGRLLQTGAPLNPTCELWRPLLRQGFPFLKRELLEHNTRGIADVVEWRAALASLPGADLSIINAAPGLS